MTKFDFSSLYNKEVVEVTHNGSILFTAIIREVSHGAKTEAKLKMLESIELPTTKNKKRNEQHMKREMKKAMEGGAIKDKSLFEEVSAIESWTLELDGKPVPVCVESWSALPASICIQLEEAIERLNPELDDDFRDDDADESTAE